MNGSGETISISTLDLIAEACQRAQNERCEISVLEIDVEGMEFAVLNGAKKSDYAIQVTYIRRGGDCGGISKAKRLSSGFRL